MSVFWIVLILLVAFGGALLAFAVVSVRRAGPERKALIRRIGRLSLRNKARLALALARDGRIPLAAHAVPPALVLYLASPIDLIPDFIPVLGYLDDVLIMGLAAGLLATFVPDQLLAEHVERLEGAQAKGGGR